MYEYRPPLDLTNSRLRKLAAALGPAYVRVGGAWANTTHLPETDKAPAKAPPGFMGVLTRAQWKGLVDFVNAVDGRIVTSFRDRRGDAQRARRLDSGPAKRFLDYTKSVGGSIAAAEFMNESNVAAMGGAPRGYDAAAYGRDFRIFHAFRK